ncbi:MAG: hypothetical protein KGI51_08450 [Rhodospirillales bacterium]|nr:hypothetical protein [Rhodospirillales bacterium]
MDTNYATESDRLRAELGEHAQSSRSAFASTLARLVETQDAEIARLTAIIADAERPARAAVQVAAFATQHQAGVVALDSAGGLWFCGDPDMTSPTWRRLPALPDLAEEAAARAETERREHDRAESDLRREDEIASRRAFGV